MNSDWVYNEFDIVGRDYSAQAEVDIYDSSHADFRDAVAEAESALDSLGLKPDEVVIDMGTGTGIFAIQAAKRGLTVHAVDVSEAMLNRARAKAKNAPITFHHAGFLSLELTDGSVDAVHSSFSFHHLPDFWKGVALQRIHRLLRPGGKFYLYDVIIEQEKALQHIQQFIDAQEEAGGEFLREDAVIHFRDEYSTYDWVMDALFTRAGFEIFSKKMERGVLGTYLCLKA